MAITTSAVLVGAGVVAGEFVTATATDFATNETSEFSNAVMAENRSISGAIRNDVNGNGDVTDDAGAVFGNAANAVRLYVDDGDGAIDAATCSSARRRPTAPASYTFAGLGDGTY